MLYTDRDHFLQVKRSYTRNMLTERANEFTQRVVGYFNERSPWYVGEGPLSRGQNFFPMALSEEDFQLYSKIICEICIYNGIESNRWSIDGLKREFERIRAGLDNFQPMIGQDLSKDRIDHRPIYLYTLGVLIYDMVYQRYDTLDRHEPNRQIGEIRSQIAAVCASATPEAFDTKTRLLLGTSLGLSTLLCMSFQDRDTSRVTHLDTHTYLPDLYLAITYTDRAIKALFTSDKRITVQLSELEHLLVIAIPWLESLNRLGYPYQIQKNLYTSMIEAFETHRIPNRFEIIDPSPGAEVISPWVPKLLALATPVDYSKYEREKKNLQPFTPFQQSTPVITDSTGEAGSRAGNDRFSIPEPLAGGEFTIQHNSRPLSLREQLELFGYPRKQPPQEFPVIERPQSNPEAGWFPPANINPPSIWGCIYLLADREDPRLAAGKIWEEYAYPADSHPYTFLYYKKPAASMSTSIREMTMLEYPANHTSILTSKTPGGHYIVALQSATATLVMPTYAIDHESFYLADNSKGWRWFHEIPSSTEAHFAASPEELPRLSIEQDTIAPVASFNTSLFSVLTSETDAGRTVLLRRHLEGVGSGYTAVAHFPRITEPTRDIRAVIVSLPESTEVKPDPETPGFFHLNPPQYGRSTFKNIEVWKQMQREIRMGLRDEHDSIGSLKLLFSPETVGRHTASSGVLGPILDIEIKEPEKPFFYLAMVDQPGREMFEVQYGMFPIPGIRIFEWQQGIELFAIKTGKSIQNDFVESDADLVVVMRDRSMSGLFYTMINGTYLRCKFSPTQETFFPLVDAKNKKVTIAWAQRRLYSTVPPESMSVFYAPGILGFECPGSVVKYGQKGRQAIVWSHSKQSG